MIKWITEYLGTASWEDVHLSDDFHMMDVRDLVDRAGNTTSVIKSKIDEAVGHLRQGRKVVICCDYGISRSNVIGAGILAVYEDISLDEAVRQVITATGETELKIEVLAAVRKALDIKIQKTSLFETVAQRILVTGASGFIGSSTLKELKRTHVVLAPTHQEIDLVQDVVKLDLLVKEQGINTLLHLANPRVYTTSKSLGMTLIMLKNVLDLCVENGLFLVYLSGWEIYSGYKTRELKADESLAPRPGGTYGQTKLLCETLINHYHQHEGVSYTILRSSPVYGPGGDRPKFIWNFLEKARYHQEIITHRYINGFPVLDLLYIEDLCKAVVAAVTRRRQGTIHVGTGIGTSTAEIAQHIIACMDSKSQIRHIEIDSYTANIIMDIRRACTLLGWSPTVDLRKGLETIIQKKVQMHDCQ